MDDFKKTTLFDLKFIAIQAILIVTFGLASMNKWMTSGLPDDFISQFGDTWLNIFPWGLSLTYYFLALLEGTAFVLFIISAAKMEWLKNSDKIYLRLGLLLSMFIFIVLSYGLRLTEQFGGTANAFFYFGVTLFALFLAEREAVVSK